jgi:hypothetical protein
MRIVSERDHLVVHIATRNDIAHDPHPNHAFATTHRIEPVDRQHTGAEVDLIDRRQRHRARTGVELRHQCFVVGNGGRRTGGRRGIREPDHLDRQRNRRSQLAPVGDLPAEQPLYIAAADPEEGQPRRCDERHTGRQPCH